MKLAAEALRLVGALCDHAGGDGAGGAVITAAGWAEISRLMDRVEALATLESTKAEEAQQAELRG